MLPVTGFSMPSVLSKAELHQLSAFVVQQKKIFDFFGKIFIRDFNYLFHCLSYLYNSIDVVLLYSLLHREVALM